VTSSKAAVLKHCAQKSHQLSLEKVVVVTYGLTTY